MDYSVLNFGQLLFLLGNEGLKNNVRNFEKINKRIVHLKSGITFNEIYIYIYIYVSLERMPVLALILRL